MKKNILVLSLTITLMFSLSIVATAQDSINTVDANLYSVPNILPGPDASPFGMNIRTNPALIDMEGDHKFIYDFSYFGSTSSVSMEMRNVWNSSFVPNAFSYATGDLDYQTHLFSTDVGFVKRFGIHSLGLVFNYSYFTLAGDGSFSIGYNLSGGGAVGSGDSDSTAKSYNYSLSLLDNIEFSDAFSLGLGLTYAYGHEALTFDVSSSWFDPVLVPAPGLESISQDREMDFYRHLISPTIGISFSPADSFVLDGSLTVGFTVGSVSKKSDLVSNIGAVLDPYREDMDSNDLFGFSIDASIEPKYRHSDTLSFPFLIDFSYSDMEWKVDGVATGMFAPITFLGIFQGQGPIEYENNTRSWDITAGAGVVYTFKGIDLKSLLSYTHEEIYNSYYQYNVVSGTGGALDGPNAYSNRVGVTRDILSIELGAKKEFSPAFSADFGLVYNISWGRIDYYQSYLSTWDSLFFASSGSAEIITDTYVKGIYHDLTLRTELAYTPVENLTIGFSGMIKLPIYGDIYEMGGSTTGDDPNIFAPFVRPTNLWGGTSSYEYDIMSLEYGGILNITYEF